MLGLRNYILLGAILTAAPASATLVTFSNTMAGADNSGSYVTVRNMWESLVSGQATVTFEDVATTWVTGILTYDTALSTYNISAAPPAPNATSAQFRTTTSGTNRAYVSYDPPVPGSQHFFRSFNGGYVQVDLPTPTTASITAIAADLWTTSSGGGTVTVRVYDTSGTLVNTYSLPTNNNSTPAFFGLTSDTAIGFLRFSSTGGDVALDRFDFALTAETPESATLGYVGLGGLAILLGARRRKVKSQHNSKC